MSNTKIVTAWMKSEISERQEVVLPDLARATVDHFEADAEFVAEFFRENFYKIAYTLGMQVCATRREVRFVHEQAPIAPGVPAPRPRWGQWLEHAGTRHIRLSDMVADDLRMAAEERRKRGETELHLAALWERLAMKLPEGKRVGDHFSEEEIDRWARLLKVEVKVSIPAPTAVNMIEEAAD